MPTLTLLVGLPATGKSTWVRKNLGDAVLVDTDSYLEAYAREHGVSYQEAWNLAYEAAKNAMYETASQAFRAGKSVVWDQTNLTANSRGRKLRGAPKHYRKVAVIFPMPAEVEYLKRLESRPEKPIPIEVIIRQAGTFVSPSPLEGFHEIKHHAPY
jgi:predicted kinase